MKRVVFLTLSCLLLLGGCATKLGPITPEMRPQMLAQIQSGNAVLDCDMACSATWIFNGHKNANRLYIAGDWEGLGLYVLQVGYQSDLSYFYLGRAAEGLGADEAALKYYRIAGALATGQAQGHRCLSLETCDGFTFPQDLYPRMAGLQNRMAQKASSRTAHAAKTAKAAKATKPKAKASSGGDDWVEPPAAASAAAPSAAVPSAATTSSDDWETPPPVVR